MVFSVHRSGISSVVAAISLLPLVLVYTGCRSRIPDGASGTPASFGVPKKHFEYCELVTVMQEADSSGSLASLAAVMKYWDTEAEEAALAEKYPPPEGKAHNIRKLRRIAIDEGLTAFALVMNNNGLEQLGEQLENGRPVIVVLQLPENTYGSNTLGAAIEDAAKTGDRFAVVFGQSDEEFLLMDPAAGVVRISKTDFEAAWVKGKHAALILSTS